MTVVPDWWKSMPRSGFRRCLEDKAVLPLIVSLSFVDAEALYALDKATGGLSLGRCPPHTLLYLLKSTTEGFRRQEKAGLVLTAIQLIVNGCQHLSGMADGLTGVPDQLANNLTALAPSLHWHVVEIGYRHGRSECLDAERIEQDAMALARLL